MIKVFESIWSDAINYERIKNGGATQWKTFTFVYMSLLLSLNIIGFLSLLRAISGLDSGGWVMVIITQFTHNEIFASFLWYLIIAILPSVLINYCMVFRNKRYEQILANHPFKQGKILLVYFLFSVLLFFGSSLLNKAIA